MLWIALLTLAGLGLVPLVIAIRRATDLFVLDVRDGRVRFVRGRIPQSLLDDVVEIVNAPVLARASLRAVRRAGHAEWIVRGDIEPGQLQRLRNVLGRYPVPRIAAGGRPRHRRR